MCKCPKFLMLGIGASVAFGIGCLIPQDIETMNELREVNRPPAIDLETVIPSSPVVRIDPQSQTVEFNAEVIDLDIDQELTALWFWDYDVSSDELNPPFEEFRIRPTGDVRRSIPPVSLPDDYPTIVPTDEPGPHSLEVFIVEENARVPESGTKPFYRNLRDCSQDAYPDDCIYTHPAVMRWTVHNG